MNSDGSGAVRILSWGAPATEPTFSPDGTKIAFVGGTDIYQMNADGTGSVDLVTSSGDSHPSYNPDGSKLVFSSFQSIYTINVDGTGLVRLTTGNGTDWDPMFSRDGSRIVFTSQRDGNPEIYVMNADGTNQQRLTNNAASDSGPCFSPDGTKIIFASDRDGLSQVFTMNADGTNQVRFSGEDGANCLEPTWAVDGMPPKVLTTTRLDPTPTSGSTLHWTVTFSEPVTGVDTTDFLLAKTGTANGSIISVTGAGSTYSVTAGSVTGDGMLTLNVADDDSIEDLGANKLGGSGVGNGAYTGIASYTVDHTAPFVSYISAQSPTLTSAATVQFDVFFSENVTNVYPGDFTFTRTGTANGSVHSAMPYSGNNYSHWIVAADVTGDGTLALNLVDDDSIIDQVGLPLGGAGLGNGNEAGINPFTLDHTAPAITGSWINAGAVQRSAVTELAVTFSEAVSFPVNSFSVVRRDGSAIPNVTVTRTDMGNFTYRVTFSGSAVVAGSLPDGKYKLIISSATTDVAGNHLAPEFALNFHRLFGDIDGDRDVDNVDLIAFRAVLNKPAAYVSYFDYDNDGLVNRSDYIQFKQRLIRRWI